MFRLASRRFTGAASGRRLFGTKAPAPSVFRNVLWTSGVVVAGGLGYLYATDSSAGVHRYVVTPLIRLLDPEDAHDVAIFSLKHGLHPVDRSTPDGSLALTLWGKQLSNPVGLAAGFDKNAEAVDALFGLGFGAVEVGSVTPEAQAGNPRPRLFRLDEEQAVINRMGLNNDGVAMCAERLRSRFWRLLAARSQRQGETVAGVAAAVNRSAHTDRLLGVNLSKSKTSAADSYDDYTTGLRALGSYADYVVINVSCPNVKNIAASADVAVLEDTIRAVVRERNAMADYRPPVVLKIGPDNDSDQLRLIAQLALDYGVDGIIATNTTRSRPGVAANSELAEQEGGLSGRPLREMALKNTREMYRLTKGRIPIIGCGGVWNAEDALAFGRAGASFVQIYTAMTFEGPGKVREIKDGLVELLKGRRWEDIIGEDAK
ncbi:dihydroorotate dehydrogenase [Coemansia sp. Benny D115]|nr:dihydroorotate dehydrogenase [Coemansia sp. Benny D115]